MYDAVTGVTVVSDENQRFLPRAFSATNRLVAFGSAAQSRWSSPACPAACKAPSSTKAYARDILKPGIIVRHVSLSSLNGSNIFVFSWILAALLHHHARCTNGPCAGSINPIIPWSTLHGNSACRVRTTGTSLPNFGNSGTAGSAAHIRTPAPPRPAARTPTHSHHVLQQEKNSHKSSKAPSPSCDVSEGISWHCPPQGSNRQP